MGKIVCVGGGCYSDGEVYPIAQRIVELSGKKNPKVLFLPTAGFDDINGDEAIEEMFRHFGCEYSILLLTDKTLTEEEIASQILSADIVYAGGGNLKFLMDVWTQTKADKYLKEAYKNGTVLSGYSSGSMCWFDRGYDDCAEDHSFMFVDCIGLLPFCHSPHYESEYWQVFNDAVKTQSLSGVACDNGAALIWNEDHFETVNGNDGGDVYYFNSKDGYKRSCITDNPDLLKTDSDFEIR